jgi:hypothetical protein
MRANKASQSEFVNAEDERSPLRDRTTMTVRQALESPLEPAASREKRRHNCNLPGSRGLLSIGWLDRVVAEIHMAVSLGPQADAA